MDDCWGASCVEILYTCISHSESEPRWLIFNIQVLNCETSRPQTFCRIFCNLKTLQPASYLYIISSCETPPEVYPQLYMFSLLTMGCCHLTLHVAARVESHLRAKLEISGIHKILSIIKENLI
jgi:hypothetical protein